MITTVRALACGFLLLPIQTAAAGPREPVAIIYHISGEALWTVPGRSPEPLRLFDRLPAAAALELAPGSRLAIAFVTGKRYEISGPARATLGKGDLAVKSGVVRPLPSVPPLPRLAPIAESEKPGPAAGAIRIRGQGGLAMLSEDIVRAREEARKILEAEGTGSLPLLAEIDRSLGLLLEAREDLRAAVDHEPANSALREALTKIEMQLEETGDHE
jgi:hypothetical protein